MRKAEVYVHGMLAGVFIEISKTAYEFSYDLQFRGEPVSLTMPYSKDRYLFAHFPHFFEGMLPEGMMQEALLRKYKIDKNDYFSQLMLVGNDLVGAVTVKEIK